MIYNELTGYGSFETIRDANRELAEAIEIEEDQYSPNPEKLSDGVEALLKEQAELQITIKKLRDYLEKEEKELNGRELVRATLIKDGIGEAGETLFENVKNLRKEKDKLEQEAKEHIQEKTENRACIHEKIPTDNYSLLIALSRELSNKHGKDVCLISEDQIHQDETPAVCTAPEGDAQAELGAISEAEVKGDEDFARTNKVKCTAMTSYFGQEKDEKYLLFNKIAEEIQDK